MTGLPSSGGQAAGWFPDPSGRHQYRYWSGAAWTDDVADAGAAGTDPIAGPAASSGSAPASRPSRARLVVAAGVAAVVVVTAVTFVVLRDGADADGTGAFTGEVADPGDLFVRGFSVPENSVIILRAEPAAGFDVTLGVSTGDGELAGRYEDFFGGTLYDPQVFGDAFDTGASNAETVDGTVLHFVDPGGEGADEELVLPAPYGGDFAAVLGGYDGSTGEVELEISVEPFDGPDDPESYVERLLEEDFTN